MTNLMLEQLGVPFGNAICYSGYRDGQSPVDQTYPSAEQVHEDLLLLKDKWRYLRLYDCSLHAERVLEVVTREQLPFQLMLGADMRAELSNPNCPWGAHYSDEQLAANKNHNDQEIGRLIDLAARYPDAVFAVSIGNEASVDWTDHLVPVLRLMEHATRVKASIAQPVTFCENYVPWTEKLRPLVEILDFISVHTYPVWEYHSVETAMDYTRQNVRRVTDAYPDKPVVITEAGWTTNSNGRGIEPHNATAAFQARYCRELLEWSRAKQILTFVFEAFDEPWKGSPDPMEPEKHWGLYTVDRAGKPVMENIADVLGPA
jgi:exo-beta-1,3-glucanase (GH17 family)